MSEITCCITGKKRNDTPEERVRQAFCRKLVEEYGYSKDSIDLGFPIQRGSKRHAEEADIAVFNSKRKAQNNIFIVVETKAPSIQEMDDQMHSYVTATTALWCVWTNGDNIRYFKTNIGSKKVTHFTEVWDLPHFSQKLGSPRKDQLTKPDDLVGLFQSLHDYIYANSNIKKPDRITTNMINMLFCKIYDELSFNDYCRFFVHLNSSDYPDIAQTYKAIIGLFKEVKKKYSNIFYDSDAIEFDRKTVLEIVSRFQKTSFLTADLDSIGTAFEVFTNESLKEDNGQFFTPRQVVRFMVRIIEPKPEEMILDPACGSGGFLIEALGKVSRDLEKGLGHRLPRERLDAHKRDVYNKYFFGIDQERDLAKISKAYMSIVGDGSGGIFSENSLLPPSDWENVNRPALQLEAFDVVLTNPPFGKDIKVRGELLRQFQLAKFWQIEGDSCAPPDDNARVRSAVRPSLLFLERCFRFLRKGEPAGRMGIVLPVGDLSNDEDVHVKAWLLAYSRLLALVQLPSETFQPYCGTQTCLVFLEPKVPGVNSSYKVFMAQAEKVGKDKRGKLIIKRKPDGTPLVDKEGKNVLDDDLDEIWDDYSAFLKGKKLKGRLSFVVTSEKLSESLLPNYHNPKNSVLIKMSKRKNIRHELMGNLCHEVYTPPRTKRVYVERKYGVPFLSGTNITQAIPQNVKYISKTQTKHLGKYIVEEGDIVVTRVGTMGIVRLIGNDLAGYAVSDNINILKVNRQQVDPEYLFVILYSQIGQQSVKRVSKGSVQHYNTPKALKALRIPILSDPEYTNIVESIRHSQDLHVASVDAVRGASTIIDSFVTD